MPMFSVIIPTRNRANLLPHAIESVLAQSITDLELIVVDDGSEDGTAEVVERYAALDPRVSLIRNATPLGAAAARNAGAAAATGEFLAFNDDDCTWRRDRLEVCARAFRSSPAGVGVVFHFAELVEPGSAVHRLIPYPSSRHIGPVSAVVRRSVFVEVGGFDPEQPRWQDVDLWNRVHARCKAKRIWQALVTCVDDGTGISSNHDALRRAASRLVDKYVSTGAFDPRDLRKIHVEMGYYLMLHRQHDLAMAHFAVAARAGSVVARIGVLFAQRGVDIPFRLRERIVADLLRCCYRFRRAVR